VDAETDMDVPVACASGGTCRAIEPDRGAVAVRCTGLIEWIAGTIGGRGGHIDLPARR
jgi:hypothetical protein